MYDQVPGLQIDYLYLIVGMVTVALVSLLTRWLPFIVFRKRAIPGWVTVIGRDLPPAMMILLVVYCFKSVSLTERPHGLPELIASVAVILLHLWRRNALVSIFGGTILYMVLVQLVFV